MSKRAIDNVNQKSKKENTILTNNNNVIGDQKIRKSDDILSHMRTSSWILFSNLVYVYRATQV